MEEALGNMSCPLEVAAPHFGKRLLHRCSTWGLRVCLGLHMGDELVIEKSGSFQFHASQDAKQKPSAGHMSFP